MGREAISSSEREMLINLNKISKKKAVYRKVVFHIHTPASYDYKYFNENNGKFENEKEFFYSLKKDELGNRFNEGKGLISETLLDEYKDCYDNYQEEFSYLFIAKKLFENNIELALVTDHNTFMGFEKLYKAIEILKKTNKFKKYVNLLLGIELSCADSHVIGIFDFKQKTMHNKIQFLQEEVNKYLLNEELGSYETSVNMIDHIHELGGLAYIAHVNTSSLLSENSLSKSFKQQVFANPNLSILGLKDISTEETVREKVRNFNKAEKSKFHFVLDEDSHLFNEVATKSFWMIGSTCNFEMVRNAFRDTDFSILLEPPKEPNIYIEGMAIEPFDENIGFFNEKHNRKSPLYISFSDSLSCLIGSRGTGKSTVLNIIDFVFTQRNVSYEDLLFLNRNKRITILLKNKNKRYFIKYLAPELDYSRELTKKEVANKFGVFLFVHNSSFDDERNNIRRYILNNLIYVYEIIDGNNERLLSNNEKKQLLKELYDAHYSINELVEMSKSEKINYFIERKLSDKKIPVPKFMNSNRMLYKIKEYIKRIDNYENDLKEICSNFNKQAEDLIILEVLNNESIRNKNYDALINKIWINVKPRTYNITIKNIKDFLYTIMNNIGLYEFIKLTIRRDIKLFDYTNLNDFTFELNELTIMEGVKSLDDDENKNEFYKILIQGIHKSLNEDFLKIYYESIYKNEIYIDLKFNVNSNNANDNKKIYKSIKNLSLGQRVVALLDFIFILGDFKGDRKPLLIDQPEDNLDNSYIYENLVQSLIKEKSKRQVIIATHNSTIVTNAKAECIIVMESDNERAWVKQIGYPYEKRMISLILKYLEGGEESFRHKEFVYQPVLKN